MAEFLMPILGADMQAGTLIAWHKHPGDVVHRGDIIAEVETDKADVEVEVFLDGVIEQLLIEEGTEVPVGTPLAIIREEGRPAEETLPTTGAATSAAPTQPPPEIEMSSWGEPGPAVPAEPPAGARVPVTPAARRLAAELGVDLALVQGTGPGGRIQLEDIRTAAEAPTAAGPVALLDRQARMRQAIAAAMTRSSREIPQFHLITTVDMSRALAWLTGENERRSVADRLLYGVLLVKAVALALREVPELNAVWENERVVLKPEVHVGLAIALRGGGLVAPALHHADQQNLEDLMRGFLDLVQRARSGSLRASEMSEPTVTVTNLGETGAEAGFGLIFPPQVALVGFGRIVERPWVVDGQVLARPLMAATLTADHRVADGHRGSVFLAAVNRLLQEPEQL
jgi:pyruvate dehydrogenase E2 component (dihydrolipoamide acetyltransferase)